MMIGEYELTKIDWAIAVMTLLAIIAVFHMWRDGE